MKDNLKNISEDIKDKIKIPNQKINYYIFNNSTYVWGNLGNLIINEIYTDIIDFINNSKVIIDLKTYNLNTKIKFIKDII